MAIPLNDLLAMQRRQALRLNQEITDGELAKVLQNAATDARQRAREVANFPGIGAATRSAQLQIVSDATSEIATGLWGQTEGITRDGIFRAADLAAFQSVDVDKVVGMPVSFTRGYEEGIRASARVSAEQIIGRRQFGYTLSERVWRNTALTTGRLQRVIESGLVNNLSARELARDVGKFVDPKYGGGASFAAKRLARTEINNSYHAVSKTNYENRPWILGVEWNLSGSHPIADACDDIAANSPYPKGEVPDKPHPQCLCFITPELPNPDEFLDSLLEGEYNDWLEENGRERIICNSSCKVTGDDGVQYQRWDTDEEQEAFLEDGSSFLRGLEGEELAAVEEYLASSYKVNGVLRGKIPTRMTDREIGWIYDRAGNLSRVIDRSPLDQDVVLFRGIDHATMKRITRGKTFSDPAFASTTLDEQMASIFAMPAPGDQGEGYIVEILAPRGTKGLRIPGWQADSVGIAPEREVLLQRNAKFEIGSVDHIARKILVKVIS